MMVLNGTLSPVSKRGYDKDSLTLSVTIILVIFIIVAVLGNSLVCLSFYQQPKLRKVCYYPIISLAIADLLCAVIAMPAYIAKKYMDESWLEGVVCDTFRFSYFFTEYASVLSLTVISIERFLGVKMPIMHKTWLNSRKMTAALIFSWLDALLISVLPFFWRGNNTDELCKFVPTREWSMMAILLNVFLPFLIMLFCHLYTISYALRYTRHSTIKKPVFTSDDSQLTTEQTKSLKSRKRERDVTRTFALVVGIFILCWGPSSFYYFLQMVCPKCYGASFKNIRQILNAVVKMLTLMNSCVNPLIYVWLNPTLRKAFLVTLIGKKMARRRRQDQLSTVNASSASPTMANKQFKKHLIVKTPDSGKSSTMVLENIV